jgi:hypothetical protein
MPIYTKPDETDPVDKLAHWLSEIHNDNAPIGWERYRPLAQSLRRRFHLIEKPSPDDPRIQRPSRDASEEQDAAYLQAAIANKHAGQIMEMVREMDAVVAELEIADSFEAPSAAIRKLKERLARP